MKSTNGVTYSVWLSKDLLKSLKDRHGDGLAEVVRSLLLEHMTAPSTEPLPNKPALTKMDLIVNIIKDNPTYSVKRVAKEAKSTPNYVNRAFREHFGIVRRNKRRTKAALPVQDVHTPPTLYQRFKNLIKGG
jgi:AraC-like DNA-binding protein